MKNIFSAIGGMILLQVIAAGLLFFPFCPQALSSTPGQEDQGGQVHFSLLAVNKPLAEVIEEISQKTGYKISFPESHKNVPVTIQLKNAGLRNGLERILKEYNKTLVIDDSSKEIVIKIFSRDLKKYGDSMVTEAPPAVAFPRVNDQGIESTGDHIDSSAGSSGGITRRELEELQSEQTASDPMEDEVVPGVTRKELEHLKSQQEVSDPLDDEIVPPDSPGGKGMTRRMLMEIQPGEDSGDSLDDEVVPPGNM